MSLFFKSSQYFHWSWDAKLLNSVKHGNLILYVNPSLKCYHRNSAVDTRRKLLNFSGLFAWFIDFMQTILSGIMTIIDEKRVLLAKISFFFQNLYCSIVTFNEVIGQIIDFWGTKTNTAWARYFRKILDVIRCLTKHLIEVSECASEVFYNI